MWFRKDSRPSAGEKSKIKRKKVLVLKSSRSEIKTPESSEEHKEDVNIIKNVIEEIKNDTTEETKNATTEDVTNVPEAAISVEEDVQSCVEEHSDVKECVSVEETDSVKVNGDVKLNNDVCDKESHVEEVATDRKEEALDIISQDGEDIEKIQVNGTIDEEVAPICDKIEEDTTQEGEIESPECDTVRKDKTDPAIPEIVIQESGDTTEETRDDFKQKELQSMALVLTDSECAPDKKKSKTKHRKTMSMSSTLELFKCLGDEWIEDAKRNIRDIKKDKEHAHADNQLVKLDADKSDKQKINDMVTLILYDASVGETDAFEVLEDGDSNSKKHLKKKDSKDSKDGSKARKISAVSLAMNAQKNTVKKIAKAGSVSALNFIRSKKKPLSITGSIDKTSIDHAILTTELLLEHERRHTDNVQDPTLLNYPKKVKNDAEHDARSSSCDDGEEDIYYDAKDEPADDPLSKAEPSKIGLKTTRVRRTVPGSLKRSGGGRRRARKRSADEAPPLPPRAVHTNSAPPVLVRQPNVHQKHTHWLFGNSFKGESKRDEDTGADTVSNMTDSSHFNSEHSGDRTDNSSQWRGGQGIASRPVTRAESYRDRADRVKRTKRKTSDPNQLTSSKDYHDVEALGGPAGGPGAPSGGSSNSSLSSKSNDSTQPDNQGSQSEWSEEEDCGGPWSARAPPELIANMSGVARKRQDLIHELIWSESSHVRWLRVLRRVYLVPLQRSGSTLLPPAELRALLPNLPDVLQRHRRLAGELRALQQAGAKVPTGPLADALISMLGEGRYAAALARFCGGQGLALDALKERRKRNKELNSFLARSEQDPLCARLRLQDLLACVWQRLTKYQLLLEGIMKTAHALDDESATAEVTSNEEDFVKVSHALELAKDVLNTVNTAIKTMENEHRLKTIQSKLEIRGVGGTEANESANELLRRLDLARHNLILEGSLSIRQDSNKRVNLLALLLKECLVLLHTDGERYILRPIPQTTHQPPLSPVIQWSAVFFRPNAAVKNGFFLVNINGTQMYELSTTSTTEYNTWTRHLYEAATALEPRPGVMEEGITQPIPPSQPPTASADSVPNGTPDPEPNTEEEPAAPKPPENEEDGNQVNGALATVVSEDEAGISGAENKMDTSLLEPAILTITQPPVTLVATVEITAEERLRRAEDKVSSAMLEALEAAAGVSGSSSLIRNVARSLVATKPAENSMEQLLLSAQDHVNKLTEVLLRALRVPITDCAMTRCSVYTDHGLCDTCSARHSLYSNCSDDSRSKTADKLADANDSSAKGTQTAEAVRAEDGSGDGDGGQDEAMDSIVILEEVGESSTDPNNDWDAMTVVESSGFGLRSIITELLTRLPDMERERELLRAKLQQAENRIHLLHQGHKDCKHSEDPGKQVAGGDVVASKSADQSSGNG